MNLARPDPVRIGLLLREQFQDISPSLLALLTHNGPMTQALKERHGPVTVDIIREGFGFPTVEEARLLGRSPRGGYWRRDIALQAGGATRLLGRTVVPPEAVRLQQALRRLGTRPLMHLLFLGNDTRPGVTLSCRWLGRDSNGRPFRRSMFLIRNDALVLTETLPLLNCRRTETQRTGI